MKLDELNRRLELLNELNSFAPGEIPPSGLRSLSIYGGAQGIFIDKEKTKSKIKQRRLAIRFNSFVFKSELNLNSIVTIIIKIKVFKILL